MLEIILIVFLILFLGGGAYGYGRREDWGNGPTGIFGVLLLIVLIVLLMRFI